MNQNNKSYINLNPIVELGLRNKFFIFIFGILSMIVGYIYISLGESYYKSSIYINQFDNYDFILKKSTQDKLDELGINPYSITNEMVNRASGIRLLKKVKSSLDNYNELVLTIESTTLGEDPNNPGRKRWLVVSKGNFDNKIDSELFLSKLINMAYEATLENIVTIVSKDITSIKEQEDIVKQNHNNQIRLKRLELNALLNSEIVFNRNKNLRKISLLENEIDKANILGFDKPQFEFIQRLPKDNFVFNTSARGTEIFDSENKFTNLNYFYGTDVLTKEIEFLRSDNDGNTTARMTELTTELETLDLFNIDAFVLNEDGMFVVGFDDNFTNSLLSKLVLEDINNSFITNDSYAVDFRIDKIETYLVNRLPIRYSLPIFFILGLFIGLAVKLFSYDFEYKQKSN